MFGSPAPIPPPYPVGKSNLYLHLATVSTPPPPTVPPVTVGETAQMHLRSRDVFKKPQTEWSVSNTVSAVKEVEETFPIF